MCPDTNGTELVYSGRATGSMYNEGSGSNYLCLPDGDPEFLEVTPGNQGPRAHLYGVEYETPDHTLSSLLENNVPCSVCYTAERAVTLMIPGRINCPGSWTREYYGYLMAENSSHRRSTYECLDVTPEVVPGSSADTNGALFFFTEVVCNGIDCPPYTEGHELTCVVCTK